MNDIDKNIQDVINAVVIEGPSPLWHRIQLARLKEDWPTLHTALINLVEVYKSKSEEME